VTRAPTAEEVGRAREIAGIIVEYPTDADVQDIAGALASAHDAGRRAGREACTAIVARWHRAFRDIPHQQPEAVALEAVLRDLHNLPAASAGDTKETR
jgi:hypothetical protein